jgi:Tol biopolymer transport system component
VGKILFLSDREGATAEEIAQAAQRQATPEVEPQPYVYDPETGELGRLTDIWPYEVARQREGWSADMTYEVYNKELLWTNVEVTQNGHTQRVPTQVLALHYYDYEYHVERIITRMGAGIVYDPVWSPTRNEIAFVATESGNDEIWTISYDGSNVQQLTRNSWEWDKHPSWSPDGEQIVFFSNRSGNSQLWLMNRDGSNQRLLMKANPYNDFNPVWVKTPDPAPPLVRQPDWRFVKPPEESQNGP